MEPLPLPPAELKALTPFIQRSNELLKADPIMSYWCTFYAAQQGISAKRQDKESTEMLMKVLDSLEVRKIALKQQPAITDDTIGNAYVENFALKVFVGADNEDRTGKATRNTAKKFIAASNFLELLKLFGDLKPEIEEKVKYAKWKAGDIAKAFREGRTPQPGPPGGLESEPSIKGGPPYQDEDDYVAREMAKLMNEASSAPSVPPSAPSVTDADKYAPGGAVATAISPGISESDSIAPFGAPGDADEEARKRERSASVARRKAQLSVTSSPAVGSPNFSMPLRHPVSREPSSSDGRFASSGSQSQSPPPPLPMTPPSGGSLTLPIPPSGSAPPTLPAGSAFLSIPQGVPGSGLDSQPASVIGAGGEGGALASRPLPTPPPRDGLPIPPQQRPSSFLQQGTHATSSNFHPHQPQYTHTHLHSQQAAPSAPPLPLPLSGLPSPPSAGNPYHLPSFVSTSEAPTSPPHQQTQPQHHAPLPHATKQQPSTPPVHPPAVPPAPVSVPPAAVAPLSATTAINGAPAPVSAPKSMPESLPHLLSTRVQKLAKFAASALDYDDLDTARKQLREALDICEGRIIQ